MDEKKYKDYEKCIGIKDGIYKIGCVNIVVVEMIYLNWNEFEIILIFMEYIYDKCIFYKCWLWNFIEGGLKLSWKFY